jgi:DNA-binding PadR family transcriptional regulator
LVTEEVIKVALGNKKNGLEIMKLLYQERTRLWTIAEGVLEAAASNEKNGLDIIEFLHQGAVNRWVITEGVLKAAARNEKYGLSIMKLLHQRRGNEFRITKGVIEAARDNTTSGMEITNFLFQKFLFPFSIIVVQELEEALAHDEEARGLLYDKNIDISFMLVRDIVWEAPAEKIYMAIKMLLSYPSVSVDVESRMHDTAPKPDPFKRHKAVLRLLLESSTSFIAHHSSDPVSLSD